MLPQPEDPDQYVCVSPALVLEVDGSRPVLYPLDVEDSHLFVLRPVDGFALSLLDGRRRVSDARAMFSTLFPDEPDGAFDDIVRRVDETVRSSLRTRGRPARGILESSSRPIPDAVAHDPRDFVVDAREFAAQMADVRTRYRLSRPIHILTVFTHHCFTNCVYCYAERPRVDEMPLERWEELLDEMVDLGIRQVSPDNGDVPARPDGLRFLEMLVRKGFNFLLSTKAPFTEQDVRRLLDAGFAEPLRGRVHRGVQLSIDAVDDDVCARLLGTSRPQTARHRRTFQAFAGMGVTPRIKTVVTGLNADQILPLVRTYHDLGARRFSFVRYERSFYRHRDDLDVTADLLDGIRSQFDAVRSDFPDVDLEETVTSRSAATGAADEESRRRAWRDRAGCGGGWSRLGIAADGSAFLCEQMVLDEPYIVGDARVQSLREIWDGERLLDFIHPRREQFQETPCRDCAEFEECMWLQGRCYRDAFFAHGSVYHPPPLCPNTRLSDPVPVT
ncbi:MAG: radical SAM protein [Actinomycetales bacterium]|nr:radical SAM protein [Actinomycetales bacterium]